MRRWLKRVIPDAPGDDGAPQPGPAGGSGAGPGAAPRAGGDVAALRAALEALVTTINASAGQLPTRAVVDARRLTDTLGEIVDTATTRPLDTYAVISLRSTMDDYLPTTLRRYLALDDSQRTPPVDAALVEQLDVLQQSVSASLDAVRQHDVQSLMIQGSFLQTRFSGSDLDL